MKPVFIIGIIVFIVIFLCIVFSLVSSSDFDFTINKSEEEHIPVCAVIRPQPIIECKALQ